MNKGLTGAAAFFSSSAIVFSGILVLNHQDVVVEALATPPFTSRSSSLVARSNLSKLAAEGRPGNPLSTLIGDMASSLASSISGANVGSVDSAAINSSLNAIVTSSWDDIRSDLKSKQTDEEKTFRSNVEKGIGRASPLNKIRLFDDSNKEEDIRVTFYRDHASWCPYCQKVWIFLEEKRIPYRVEKINMRCYGEKPASFNRLQPSGAIPVAIIDGTVYNQSNDIIFTLEQIYSGDGHKPMLPAQTDEEKRMKAQQLLKLERSLFSGWMYWLTGSSRAKASFINVLNEVESELEAADGDFFLGKEISLVDCMFAPFLERIAASMIFFKGFKIRVAPGERTDYPSINKWFDAMETMDSYSLTKGCYYSHCWDLPPQLGGCTFEDGGEPYEKAINGERLLDGSRGSWELPLESHLGGVEPDWSWCGDEKTAKREAVERLAFNSKAIVRFATRGAGKKGMPPYSAALSDPNATPNESVQGSVDAVIRILSKAMLHDTNTVEDELAQVVAIIAKEGGSKHTENVISSLAYLRDRIGVPRDMRLPAARQLRAHLNYAIEKML